MSPLRMRMIEDMKLAGLSPGTQATYIAAVRKLAPSFTPLARSGSAAPLPRLPVFWQAGALKKRGSRTSAVMFLLSESPPVGVHCRKRPPARSLAPTRPFTFQIRDGSRCANFVHRTNIH